jgi:hypothetical protein
MTVTLECSLFFTGVCAMMDLVLMKKISKLLSSNSLRSTHR